MGITSPTLSVLNSTVKVMLNRIVSETVNLVINNNSKTLCEKDLKSVIYILFPQSMIKDSVENGDEALKRYSKFENDSNKSIMRETRAGLIISVSLVEKYIRLFGANKLNVNSGAPVFLAGVIEQLIYEQINMAEEVAQEHQKHRISARHFFLAINKNQDYMKIYETFSIVLLQNGVLPHIESKLIEQRQSRKKKRYKSKTDKGKQQKWLPGTVAMREIKKQQKNKDLLLQSMPLNRVIREITKNINNQDYKVRFTEQAFVVIQTLTEQKVIKLFQHLNKFALHTKRETVNDQDFYLFQSLNNISCEPDNSSPISNPGIQRLARRAGVIRLQNEMNALVKGYINYVLAELLESIISLLNYQKKVTVSVKTIQEVLSIKNIHLGLFEDKK